MKQRGVLLQEDASFLLLIGSTMLITIRYLSVND